jgi:OOP family OmpA-OmpF porin
MAGTGFPQTRQRSLDGLVNLSIEFVTGSAEISEQGRQQLDQLGVAINLPILRDRQFRIAGFTDAVGDAATNKLLSQARADAVVQYLVEKHSVSPARLYAEGFGEDILLDRMNPASPRNRRIEIRAWLPPEG